MSSQRTFKPGWYLVSTGVRGASVPSGFGMCIMEYKDSIDSTSGSTITLLPDGDGSTNNGSFQLYSQKSFKPYVNLYFKYPDHPDDDEYFDFYINPRIFYLGDIFSKKSKGTALFIADSGAAATDSGRAYTFTDGNEEGWIANAMIRIGPSDDEGRVVKLRDGPNGTGIFASINSVWVGTRSWNDDVVTMWFPDAFLVSNKMVKERQLSGNTGRYIKYVDYYYLEETVEEA